MGPHLARSGPGRCVPRVEYRAISEATRGPWRASREALAYRNHPLLGERLRECNDLVLAVPDRSARDIFGSPDELKLRSCLTLFETVAAEDDRFGRGLDLFFGGVRDPLTLDLLSRGP